MIPDEESIAQPSQTSRPAAGARKAAGGRDQVDLGSDPYGDRFSRPSVQTVRGATTSESADPGWVIETIFSPFHCLYQDALYFHTKSRVVRSESEASRLSRSALLLYVSSAESLVHQAAEELGRQELRGLISDPSRPMPLAEAWRLLPAITAEPGVLPSPFQPDAPPWPQFAELLMLRTSWAYPGSASARRALYRSVRKDGDYEPIQPHQIPAGLRRTTPADGLNFPRTGLPRDPYALRPRHLDTARGILDAAIEALDRRMGGAITKGQRHRREPVRVVHPPSEISNPSEPCNES